MMRLRTVGWCFGITAALVHCGPSASEDNAGGGGSGAQGGAGRSSVAGQGGTDSGEADSGGAGRESGGGMMSNAGEPNHAGADDGPGGAGSNLGGAPPSPRGAGGMSEAGAGGEPEPEPVGPYTIATGQLAPTGIAVSDKYAYWANRDAGTIVRCPRHGCGDAPPTVLASGVGAPRGLAIDTAHVYWINEPATIAGVLTLSVYKCPLSGCPEGPTLVTDWTGVGAGNKLLDVHVVGGTLYIAAWPLLGTCSIEGCHTPSMITMAPCIAIDTDAQYFYGSYLGWSQVVRCPLAGCGENRVDLVVLAPVAGRALTIDQSAVYFSRGGEILKCPLSGCGQEPPTTVVPANGLVDGVTSDTTRLYFTNVELGTVSSVPK